MNLVIVESPAKARTIEKYLGSDYKVKATLGHIIDLPTNKIAVDTENGYEPDWTVMAGKTKTISELKKSAPKESEGKVYLAMDPDREGEAIAYHTAKALKLKNPIRITFHEITKTAIQEAMKNPGKINDDLVQAQFARRILDRLVGYKLSQLLWKKIWYGLSAGRVQSVALRLIVEREREIRAFVPQEFWDLTANLLHKKSGDKFSAILKEKDDKKITVTNGKQADEIENAVNGEDFVVSGINKKTVKKHAIPPFTTSTLQQAANNILGFPSKRTMAIAQVLYQAGHISYMRTDSVNLSQDAIVAIRATIAKLYGKEYVPEKPNFYKNKARNAQEAHEAIRPSHMEVTYAQIEKEMGTGEAKLYDLIYKRALASQMSEKISEVMSVKISCDGKDEHKYTFGLGAEKVLFDGFRRAYQKASTEDSDLTAAEKTSDGEVLQNVSDLHEGDLLSLKELVKLQKFTEPKPRYTEASLVKALESYGVGRPSTYSTIISTIIDRGYVTRLQKALLPTDIGFVVTEFLEKNFTKLVNYEYTAAVEGKLDDIAEGKIKYIPFLDAEYKPFVDYLVNGDKVDKNSIVILGKSEEKCPECGSEMVIRLGRFGKFLSCGKFPECKGMKALSVAEGGVAVEEVVFDPEKFLAAEPCPKCGGEMELKASRFGKFWACKNYPKCKGAVPLKLKENCPECGKPLVERKGRWGKTFTGCSGYPDCKYIKKAPGAKDRPASGKASKTQGTAAAYGAVKRTSKGRGIFGSTRPSKTAKSKTIAKAKRATVKKAMRKKAFDKK
jgi:DNA topoisomerase-1